MTNELQKAMARYEAARGAYRVAVLGSFDAAGGEAIRRAIAECQAAREHLQRVAFQSAA